MSSFQQFLQQWSPAIFCGLIVLLNLSYIHTSQLMGVFSFLPICFFFACSAMYSMRKQILALQSEVSALQVELKALA